MKNGGFKGIHFILIFVQNILAFWVRVRTASNRLLSEGSSEYSQSMFREKERTVSSESFQILLSVVKIIVYYIDRAVKVKF